MIMLDDRSKALVSYRLESAREKLSAAEDLFENGHYRDSVSRSYYAIFTAARALLVTKGLDSSKHSGVIALFNQHFVKTDEIQGLRANGLNEQSYTVSKPIMGISISFRLRKQRVRLTLRGNLSKKLKPQ